MSTGAYPPETHCRPTFPGIRSLAGFGTSLEALAQPVALPPGRNGRRCTSMHFGENELSRGAIGFSPLPSPHRTVLQHRPLRASRRFYPSFTQGKGRSPRFASAPRDLNALFGLAFATASPNGLAWPLRTTPWLILQKARSRATKTLPLACRLGVSGSISLPFRGSFHLSLTVLYAIGQPVVLSLGGWSPQIPTTFHVGRGTREHAPGRLHTFNLRGFHPLRRPIPGDFG